MKIVLFHPRGFSSTGNVPVSTLAASLPPVGLASIAAVLRKHGHEVSLLDAARTPRVPNSIWAKRIAGLNPDMVGFSAITSAFLDAYDVCEKLKRQRESIRTVFGGVHASWGKASLLEQFSAIDCIVAGEGEYSLRDLAAGVTPSQIEGLSFRNGGAVMSGPERTTLCAMDDLPFPAYDLVEGFPRGYAPPLFSYPRFPGASIISSRGCVYQCSYCDRSVFHQSFRWNSPRYTFELVKRLRTDFSVRHVTFYDDLFTLNRQRVAELCALLRAARLGVTFNCIVRIGHIDKKLIAELKSAGCWMVHVGIESGDQAILDSHKQGLQLDEIRRDVEALHRGGLWVKGLFMMGFPGENESSIVKTIEFAKSLPLKDANITAFTPFPGAPISKEIASLGAFENDWSKMDCVNFVFVPKEIGSKHILQRRYRQFIREFYNRPFMRRIYRAMLWQSPHSYWRLLKNLAAFLRYRKKQLAQTLPAPGASA